jgi:hypothetical protein
VSLTSKKFTSSVQSGKYESNNVSQVRRDLGELFIIMGWRYLGFPANHKVSIATLAFHWYSIR